MLTTEQRSELENLGIQNVRFKLAGSSGGRPATLNQFLPSGDVTKGDVEDWLLENGAAEVAQQRATLRWAMIAGWSGIVSVILAGATLAYSIWFQK
jgi:hypothetical protein